MAIGELLATDVFTTPERTLREAIVEAREMHRLGDSTIITIHLAPGTYSIEQTLTLRPEDSRIRIVGETDADGNCLSRISGAVALTPQAKRATKETWCYTIPQFHGRPLEFRQLYADGKKLTRAKDVSDWEDMATVLSQDRTNKVLYVPATPALKEIAKAGIKNTEMILHEMWCVSVLRIKEIKQTGDSMAISFHNPEADLQFSHPWPSPLCHDRPKGWNASPFYLTNHPSLLDEQGEWYRYPQSEKVIIKDESSKPKAVCAPAVETLLAVEGTLDRMTQDITFENIAFEYSNWNLPSFEGHVPLQAGMRLTEAYQFKEPMKRSNNFDLDNQGWLERPASAVRIRGGENICFRHCEFTHLGSSGIDYEWGSLGGSISDCHFSDIAGNAIVAGSFSPAGLETHIAYNPSDRREVVTGLKIIRNRIHDIGTEDWGTVAIAAGYVAGIEISGNHIEEVPYTAISLGWGWNADISCMHDNKVHHNTIRRFAKHMYDCAAIYTLGNQPGSEIYENTISDIYHPRYVHDPEHWFWLYTDEGSSNIYVHDNHCPSDKFLQNANGPCNVWINNVDSISSTEQQSLNNK